MSDKDNIQTVENFVKQAIGHLYNNRPIQAHNSLKMAMKYLDIVKKVKEGVRIECCECSHIFLDDAEFCPHCGHPNDEEIV